MKKTKKMFSVVLSLVMAFSMMFGITSTAYAKGWADRITEINLNEETTFYCNDSNKSYTTLGSNGYRFGASFVMPANGVLNIESYSEYEYGNPKLRFYKSGDLENPIGDFNFGTQTYVSAYGLYKNVYSTSLSAGSYCVLFDVYDCSDSIREGKVDGTFNITFNFKPGFGNSSISSLSARKKAFKVNWKKCSNVSGYQLQYSRNKNMQSAKTILLSSGSSSKTVKTSKAKKTYYVRIRTYKKININGIEKTYYGKWSPKKSIKTK